MSNLNTWEISDPGGNFPVAGGSTASGSMGTSSSPFSTAPITSSPNGAAPLFNLGGYGTVANSFSISQGADGSVQVSGDINGQGVDLTDTSSGILVDTSTTTASNNIVTQGWSEADPATRVLIILGILGIIASLKG
jgi:hypothetical protein